MTTATATVEAHAPPEFLLGGGETGAFMRDINWSITPLGAPGSWPLKSEQFARALSKLLFSNAHLLGPGSDDIFQ